MLLIMKGKVIGEKVDLKYFFEEKRNRPVCLGFVVSVVHTTILAMDEIYRTRA